MTTFGLSKPSAWAAYVGAGQEDLLKRVLGDAAQTVSMPGTGVGVCGGSGESAVLTVDHQGRATARIGVADAGCEVTVASYALTLSCDLFGLHGIYTAQHSGAAWFASDPRLLRRLPGVGDALDPTGLHGYLCFSYVPAPHTAFAGISCLPAGSRLDVTPDHCQWQPGIDWKRASHTGGGQENAVCELRALLREAVRHRVGPDREVGVFLSGGLDSSLVAALLAEDGVRTHLFTLDFGPPFDAELPLARQVAAHLEQTLHVVDARPAHIRRALDGTASSMHQPFGDAVTVPLFLLGQAAAGHVGTIFNGEGGDQLFGGWANKPMIAAELYGASDYRREDAYLATFHRFHGLTDGLYTPRARQATEAVSAEDWVRPALQESDHDSLLDRLRTANMRLKGAQNIAPRATQLAAAHGLRVRAPFFDHALWDWTCGLPPEWFLRGACEKYLLKRAAEPLLPPEIVWREKRGMGVPATEWCQGPLRREIGRRLSSRTLRQGGWFEPSLLGLRQGKDTPGEFRRRRIGEKLWTLVMLHVWQSQQAPPLAWPSENGSSTPV